MPNPVCRVGDQVIGTCFAHENPVAFVGVWAGGSNVVTADGLGVVRVGDTGTTNCGHTIMATSGSAPVTADGIPVVRVGDTVIVTQGGTGIIVAGSTFVVSD